MGAQASGGSADLVCAQPWDEKKENVLNYVKYVYIILYKIYIDTWMDN